MNSRSSELTDQEVVAATLKDRQMFGVLVERYQAALARYIKRLGCTDPEFAKDILQESFIKAYVNLNDFDSSLSFSNWMYRITHNETISHFRKVRRRPRPVEAEKDLVLFEKIADDLDLVLESDIKLRAQTLAGALSELSGRYRDVMVLRFFEDKSYDEISDILQIPPGTVATYLSRGKAELRKILKKHNVTDV